jgi:hypothetical protein
MEFSIGIRHILEDCLKTTRGRPLDPARRAFAIERGAALVSKALRAHDAAARATGLFVDVAEEDMEAYRFVMDHGGSSRPDIVSHLRAAESALGALAKGAVPVPAREIAAAEDLFSRILAAGMHAEAARAMETH